MNHNGSNNSISSAQGFDVLGDVLETLRFRGSIFFRSQLAAPWGMKLEPATAPRFHIALHGDCVLGRDAEASPVRLKQMDIILLPHGDMHWIADRPNRKLVPSERAGKACELGNPLFQQGQITHKLICGILHYEKTMRHPILDALPGVLHFSNLRSEDPIWATVSMIDAEMENTIVPRTALVDRLTEVLFLQLLYRHVEENCQLPGFLAALTDRRVYRLLELIHREPEKPWTLESLGEQAGMSRTTVARQFRKTIGTPPLTYLANWRMMKALHLARQSALPLEEIADAVGFSSARSLAKAFSRTFGYTPSQLRKQQQASSP